VYWPSYFLCQTYLVYREGSFKLINMFIVAVLTKQFIVKNVDPE